MFKKLLALHALNNSLVGWFSDGQARVCTYAEIPLSKAERARVGKRNVISGAYLAAEGYGIAWSSDTGITADAFYQASEPYNVALDLQSQLLGDIVSARKQSAFSQAQLGCASGIKQPVIARMETGACAPRLDTMLKVLAPLGKTLAVVDLH